MQSIEVRKILKLTQTEMARACNVSPMTVSRWETGERKPGGMAVRIMQIMIELNKADLFGWYKILFLEKTDGNR